MEFLEAQDNFCETSSMDRFDAWQAEGRSGAQTTPFPTLSGCAMLSRE
jgi:hypothetical protein